MNPRQDREGERDDRDRGPERNTPVRRDENEAVPEFERGSDLDRGQEEQDERQSER
jgi:hypothetical protein